MNFLEDSREWTNDSRKSKYGTEHSLHLADELLQMGVSHRKLHMGDAIKTKEIKTNVFGRQ